MDGDLQVRTKLLQHFEFQYRKAMQASDWGSLKLPRSLETKVLPKLSIPLLRFL